MTRKQLIFAGVLPFVFALGTTACACHWDSDTLQMERLRFPGIGPIPLICRDWRRSLRRN